MKHAVVFDLDGTLLDTLQDLADAGNHTLRALDLPTRPVDDYRQLVGNGIPHLVKSLLPPNQQGEAIQKVAEILFKTRYDAHSMDATVPYPGITGLLATLRADGVFLAVLSNKADENVRHIAAHFFPGLLDAAVGKQDAFPPKPNPASLLVLMHQHGLDPASTIYVGDSDVDVHTAHNAGLFCVGVTWGFRGREELAGAGADALADDARGLEQILWKRFGKYPD